MWKTYQKALFCGFFDIYRCGMWKTPDFLYPKLWKIHVMITLPLLRFKR